MSFKEYLESKEICVSSLPQVVQVDVMKDESCEMAYIDVNGKTIHYGNYCDFYDGCHDHPSIGEFNSLEELLELIEIGLNDLGHVVEITHGEFEY